MMTTRRTPDVLAGLGQGGDDALGLAMGPQVRLMDGAALRMDGGTQPREEISDELVLEYKEAMQAGAQFPPVVVFFDGSVYWLADGYHRVHAADAAGVQVLVDVRQGTRRDAVLHSVGANAAHGLRRTNADKRRAVMALLHDEEWRQWSDREIARRCAVSDRFVNSVRAELSANGSQIETRRVVRNGTEYTMAPAQRTPGAAVAAQQANYATPEELKAAVRAWLDGYDQDQWEPALNEVKDLGEGSVTFDDLREWIDVTPRHARDLQHAAVLVLVDLRRERLLAAKAEADARRERLLAAKAEADAQWEREQAEYRSKQVGAFVGALTPWTAEELEEELLSLDGVSLPGADDDWLFEYMQGIAKRSGHSITRPVFDMAMRLATPRQVAALQRQDRLERAQAAAMAADAERARSETGQSGVKYGDMLDSLGQCKSSVVTVEPETIDWRRTRGQITEDGRVLVQMSNGTKNAPWLELDDAGQHWMVDLIRRAQVAR